MLDGIAFNDAHRYAMFEKRNGEEETAGAGADNQDLRVLGLHSHCCWGVSSFLEP